MGVALLSEDHDSSVHSTTAAPAQGTRHHRSIADLCHGDHACLLYDDVSQLLAVSAEFLRIGLERHDRCLFLGAPHIVAALERSLVDAGIDVAAARSTGALRLTSERPYLSASGFDATDMVTFLDQEIQSAIGDGFRGLRATGDMTWQLGPTPKFDAIAGYEATLDAYFDGRPLVGICQYRRHEHSPSHLCKALSCHPVVALDDERVTANPYHEPTVLQLDHKFEPVEQVRLDWMTRGLRDAAERGRQRDQMLREQIEQATSRELQERMTAVLERTSDAFLALDTEWRITFANSRSLRLCGHTLEEVCGRVLWEICPGGADSAIGRKFRQAAESQATMSFEVHENVDGQDIWLDIDAYPSPQGLSVFYRDITPRKRHEAQLRALVTQAEQAKLEAQRADVAKSRFLAAASHDLRQPIQSLFLFAEALSMGQLADRERNLLAHLGQGLQALKSLLDAILDISKLEAGVVQPAFVHVPVDELLAPAAVLYKERAAAQGLDFRYVGSQAQVRTDPALFSRIINNLLENSLRYTPDGQITLGCRQRGPAMIIAVSDTGIGIPPDKLSDIFEEFVQVANVERNRTQGLGLGLAVVRRVALLLGHKISVDSAIGNGSTFEIELPLAEPA